MGEDVPQQLKTSDNAFHEGLQIFKEDSTYQYYLNGEEYDWVTDPKRLEKIFHRKRERVIAEMLEEYSYSNSSILDIGCGTGLITRNLHAEQTVGLDINLWNLRKTNIHSPLSESIQSAGEQLPFRSSIFSAVLCTDILEHVPEPRRILEEAYRVLKQDGTLIGSVPSDNILWRFRKYMLSTCPGLEPFHRNYSITQVSHMLSAFETVKVTKGVYGMEVLFVAQKSNHVKPA
jgi:ubiquinone/menaquinone biosynthesis C-methylase UbiE